MKIFTNCEVLSHVGFVPGTGNQVGPRGAWHWVALEKTVAKWGGVG